jgi:outer membrane protein TolC
VETGTLDRVELVQAEAGVALRQEAVVIAEAEVANASDALARLIYGRSTGAFERMLVPAEDAAASLQPAAVGDSLSDAERHRSELAVLRLAIDNGKVAERVASNAELPDLAAVGSVAVAGAQPSLGGAHREAAEHADRQYRWSIGLELSYPLGNRAATSAHDVARIELQRAQLALDAMHKHIEADVRASVRGLNASIARVEITGRAVELAQQQLDAERARLEAGTSTAFQVLRLETDLAAARNAQAGARADYGLRKLDLSRAVGVLDDDPRWRLASVVR